MNISARNEEGKCRAERILFGDFRDKKRNYPPLLIFLLFIMILFLCSLPAEKNALQNILASIPKQKYDILLTGVGVYQTIYSLTNYLHTRTPDMIVNVGICGRRDAVSTDWVQIYRIKHLGNGKESLCPIYIEAFSLASIGCSDTIITDMTDMQEETLVDMESFGVHFVCQREKIPFLICKKPFDIVSIDSKKIDLASIVRAMESFPVENIFEKIEHFLAQNHSVSSDDIDHIAKKHRLTWSEKEMLQFAVNRVVARGENRGEIVKELGGKTTQEIKAFFKEGRNTLDM